jgi:glycosyltransferase involved in cell wall biosynthesis
MTAEYGNTGRSLQNADFPDARAAAPQRVEILFLIDYFQRTGGTEKHLAQLVAGLPEQFRCSVVVFDMGVNPLLEELRGRGVPVIHLPVGREYVPNALLQAWRLSRLIRRNRYHIVQTFHQKADTYGALIAWLSGARHLVSSKRDTGALRKPLHVFLNRRLKYMFDAFIMVAEAVRLRVMARDDLPAGLITTIYNGVDLARFTPPSGAQRAEARRRFGFAADDFVVGMVAAFRPEKNFDVFLDALELVAIEVPSLKVLAVGDGPLLEAMRARVNDTALGGRLVFTGEVVDVLPCLWSMDVGCLTSGSNEGFSNAVVEQMAVGLPVVVTDVGGNAEAVIDGENGFVIPPRDAVALSRVLLGLHADPARAAAMGRASRRLATQRFSLERMCAEHARLYLSLCDAVRPVSGEWPAAPH